MAPALDFLWGVAISYDRGATVTAGIVQAHPFVHYLLPLPDELLHQSPDFGRGVLAQAIHMPADVSLLQRLVGDVHVCQVLQQAHQLVVGLRENTTNVHSLHEKNCAFGANSRCEVG